MEVTFTSVVVEEHGIDANFHGRRSYAVEVAASVEVPWKSIVDFHETRQSGLHGSFYGSWWKSCAASMKVAPNFE